MKNNYIIKMLSLALVVCSITVSAQNTIQLHSATCTSSMTKLTVRNSSSGNEIISSQLETYFEFLKFDQTLAGRKFDVKNILVSDFTVLDGIVYFCGRYLGVGAFGYFNEADFANSQITLNVVNLPNLEYADKIKVYVDPIGVVNVAVIGKSFKSGSYVVDNDYLYVGEINGISYSYHEYPHPNTSPYDNNEYYYQDLTVTDNYIVTVGYKDWNNQEMCVTKIDKSNLTSNSHHIITDPDQLSLNSLFVLEALEGDTVAFASLFFDINDGRKYARLYTYDVSSSTNTGIQDVLLPEKTTFDDLKYLPHDRSLLLLLTSSNYPTASDISSIVYYLDPYATSPYMAYFLYDPTNSFHSLDRMQTSHFIIGGKTANNERYYIVRDKRAGKDSQCQEYGRTSVDIKEPLTGVFSSTIETPSSVPFVTVDYYVYDIPIYQDCTE